MFLVIPYGNDRKNSRPPLITYFLIAGNIAVFLVLLPMGERAVVSQFGLSPSAPSIVTILTSMFVHASPLHLIWNVLFLGLFGPSVEDVLGHIKFIILYVLSGVLAALLHIIMVRNYMSAVASIPVLGASGAIAGILGIFAVRFYRTRIKLFWYVGILFYPLRWGTFTLSAMVGLGIWPLQQFAGGVLSVVRPLLSTTSPFVLAVRQLLPEGVAYWSHIGGMAFGVIMAYALGLRLQGTKEYLWKDARTSMEEGTTWHAAAHLCNLLECDPDDPDVHAYLANTYAAQQDADLSVAHFQKSIELYLRKGASDRAVATFADLKHYYRNAQLDLKSEYQLARHMGDSGHHEAALSLLKDIISTYPGTPEAEVALMKAGDLYLNVLANPVEAVRCYEMFMKEYPASSWAALVAKSLTDARSKAV